MRLKEIERMIVLKGKGYQACFETGLIRNKRGNIMKTKNKDGYVIIQFEWQKSIYTMRAHRYIFWLKWNQIHPQLDHINGIRDDNRIENLRSSTPLLNSRNKNFAKGYYLHKKTGKYEARIRYKGTNIYLGQYEFKEQARSAYEIAKKNYYKL